MLTFMLNENFIIEQNISNIQVYIGVESESTSMESVESSNLSFTSS